jgi:zinc/manganese transport system substrate-binding protein/manganese/iron transport system substrate-binding protein
VIKRSCAVLALAGSLGVLTIGCGSDGSGDGSKVAVVATTTQVGDLVRNVAGGRAEVTQLLQANSDPHGYEPRPSDALAVSEADVVFRSGGDVDEWLDDLTESAGAGAEVVTLIDRVRRRGDDPHWWQDPRNGILAVGAIREALSSEDPAGRPVYRRNADAYARRLRRLDRSAASCVRGLPRSERRLVTTHDSLGYFADRYGFEVIGALIPSLSTQAQPSAGDIDELVRQIRDEGVEAIFPESSLSPKLERAVAREADAEVGGRLWADTLGPEGSRGATYAASIASNTATIVRGLSAGRTSCRLDA